MSCSLISAGISRNCDNNVGGITNIWITDFSNIVSVTESAGSISAITMASGTIFYEYEFIKHTSTFSEKQTISIENGTAFAEQTVTLKLSKRQKSTRNNLLLLLHKELAIVVLDSNGLYWFIGETQGANVSDIPSESGTQAGDFNGYTITFMGQEPTPAPEVASGVISALI